MNGMKEMMAMMRAVKIMESLVDSEEKDRHAVVSAEFDKCGELHVKIDGRSDFLMAAMSALFHNLAEQARVDQEELYYLLCAINGVKEDIEKLDAFGDDEDEPKLKIKFDEGDRNG